jgi:hypothetical protein
MPPRKSVASAVDADASIDVSAAGVSHGTPKKKKDEGEDKERDSLGVEVCFSTTIHLPYFTARFCLRSATMETNYQGA